jgi:hypothetical protein
MEMFPLKNDPMSFINPRNNDDRAFTISPVQLKLNEGIWNDVPIAWFCVPCNGYASAKPAQKTNIMTTITIAEIIFSHPLLIVLIITNLSHFFASW